MNYKNECVLQEFISIKVGFKVTLCHMIPDETDNTSTLKPSILQTKKNLHSLFHRLSIKSVKIRSKCRSVTYLNQIKVMQYYQVF